MAKNANSDFLNEMSKIESENQVSANEDKENSKRINEVESTKLEDEKNEIYALIEKEGGPSKETIDEWRNKYGDKVYVMRIDENETYIYRYITRPEFKNIANQISEVQKGKEDLFSELVCKKCVLYPKIDEHFLLTCGAGTLGSLTDAIQFVSNFIPDSMLMQMIYKL